MLIRILADITGLCAGILSALLVMISLIVGLVAGAVSIATGNPLALLGSATLITLSSILAHLSRHVLGENALI